MQVQFYFYGPKREFYPKHNFTLKPQVGRSDDCSKHIYRWVVIYSCLEDPSPLSTLLNLLIQWQTYYLIIGLLSLHVYGQEKMGFV